MKKLLVLATLLLAATSAHAGGISFMYEGKRITIDAPRGCTSLSCATASARFRSTRRLQLTRPSVAALPQDLAA